MSKYIRVVIAGASVAEGIEKEKRTTVARLPGGYDSEALCAFQQRAARAGIVEAEIVESIYGYTVRYASGLHNFGLIYSVRARQVDGTLEDAITKAKQWQAADPDRRFVTMTSHQS